MSPDQIPQLDQTMSTGLAIGIGVAYLLIYIFVAYVLAKIGNKLGWSMGKAFAWAFIPILNIFYILKLAEKPMWWIILMIIPIVNIVIMVLVWMRISVRLGKPEWWGFLMLIPFVNFIIPLILAFGKTEARIPAPAA